MDLDPDANTLMALLPLSPALSGINCLPMCVFTAWRLILARIVQVKLTGAVLVGSEMTPFPGANMQILVVFKLLPRELRNLLELGALSA